MRILLLLFLIACSFYSSGQRVRLTNTASGKTLYLTQGQRVQFMVRTVRVAAYPGAKAGIGNIEKITTDSVTVKGRRVAIADLGGIGRRRSGSGFAAYALTFVGVGLILSAANSGKNDPCPTCQTAPGSDDGSTSNTIAVIGGLAFVGLAINTVVRNSVHNSRNWKIDVVD
jgi:hypothetical protein